MTTITIPLSDDSMSRLQELAVNLGLTPEELLRRRVEDLLSQPDEEFLAIAKYVLEKNAELYRRLA